MKTKALLTALDALAKTIPHANRSDTHISAQGVGWHIAHSLTVIEKVCQQTIQSDPEAFRPSFKLSKTIVLLTGYIPRGAAKAPKVVLPEPEFDPQKIEQQVLNARNLITQLEKLPPRAFFEHPYFGHVALRSVPRFLEIHTRHHLKIIQDILHT
ncbi:MAG: hypothetical protein ACFCUI_09405 [Bernardetiaceae bacterium]